MMVDDGLTIRLGLRRCRLSTLLLLLLPGSIPAAPVAQDNWQTHLEWQARRADIVANNDGSYDLKGDAGPRHIDRPAWTVKTASPLFDGLFAMAQADLKADSVAAITDAAFDHGKPIACECFSTGEKWPFVWTRDLSYSVDLGLWRFDPSRARNSLRFKLSTVREPDAAQGTYVMQDTGSGGSWPISTDRVVWFLGARHLRDDAAFADTFDKALVDTLAQDRLYTYDPVVGLYRGETSFLDWREQTYPAWTKDNVVAIAQSFALSTNVLHYEALRLAAQDAGKRHAADASRFASEAEALKRAIDTHFWRADRGLYMSYIGGEVGPQPYDTYDLLGLSLVITSGIADADRAREILAHYPSWPAGSPVIWPERADQAIYHNRAIWPFVSAYALRAARIADAPAHIAGQVRSLMRGAALGGSNMENFDLATMAVHVDEGPLSGPVVDSPRQLWSVAGYLNMVVEGVFGLTDDGRIEPKLPVSLVPMLFGAEQTISLHMADRRIVLKRPEKLSGNLLVADTRTSSDGATVVQLKGIQVKDVPVRTDAPTYAPVAPPAPEVKEQGDAWQVAASAHGVLYINGRRHGDIDGSLRVPRQAVLQCFDVTALDASGLESMHSPSVCEGPLAGVDGAGPWRWTAPRAGRFQLRLSYTNDHGPIPSGVTAAVKRVTVRCGEAAAQTFVVVMPHSVGEQLSTAATFTAPTGARCDFALGQGFNMSFLGQFARYTQGQGGSSGPLNAADVDGLQIRPLGAATFSSP
ncbi:MAG TPA: Six-hairpin glycosidase-like protein [Luteibacter sp.]|jgi:hypothetical protein|nr:Six-hairpin glycosidase-like protein [Luteibacter sp.]